MIKEITYTERGGEIKDESGKITHTIFPHKIEGIPMIGEPSTEKLYRWVKASERLPNNDKPVFAKDVKGAKSASFYSRQHQTPVEDFDDTGDLDSFNDTLYLKEGWYEETEQSSGQYDIVYQKRKITEWLEEYTQPKAVITDAEIEKMAEDAGYPQSDKESFECTYWTLHNVFTKGFKASQSLAKPTSAVITDADIENLFFKNCNHKDVFGTDLMCADDFVKTFKASQSLQKWNGVNEEQLRKAIRAGLSIGYGKEANIDKFSEYADQIIQSITKPTSAVFTDGEFSHFNYEK